MSLAAVFGFLAIRNNQRARHIRSLEHVVLAIEPPNKFAKSAAASEEFFASLHGTLRNRRELAVQGGLQEHISLEVAASGGKVRFYAWVPHHLQNFVESQVYANYPDAKVYATDHDYTMQSNSRATYTTELNLSESHLLPIKTYAELNEDPLLSITDTMAQAGPEEEVWLQLLVRPTANDWHASADRTIGRIKSGAGGGLGGSLWLYVLDLLEAMWRPPQGKSNADLNDREKTRIAAIEQKRSQPGFKVKIRLICLAPSEASAKHRALAVANLFSQFNQPGQNGLTAKKGSFSREGLAEYRARFFIDKGFILNTQELATLYHLPYSVKTDEPEEPSGAETATEEALEVNSNIPLLTGAETDKDISAFGLTAVGETTQHFGIYTADRSRHMYIIGQTGTGKTGMLELLALSDIFHKQGYAIIDPHGDFATNNLRYIPSWRTSDVVYFNPADTANPIGFNPMEVINPAMKSVISSEVIGVLKRMFGESWGPRLEHILRFTILALLDYPETTLLDITRMLTDKQFRETVLHHTEDAVVRQFWYGEFATWNDRFAAEAVAPVLNKIGAFTANPIIRNIIGQPKSTFNIRQIMDDGKILIVNLSKGLIGEDNAAILGSFLVTKIQLAAMSRSDIPRVEDRRPFNLYVDEFQNFATDSFATILSEARKYGLNLTVANQYVSQMTPSVRDAVFGNVGTLISFRLSADDAPVLHKHFEPQFTSADLIQLHNRNYLVSMVVNGEKVPPFAGTTLSLPPVQSDLSEQIVENTRHGHTTPRVEVEKYIHSKMGQGRPKPHHPVHKKRNYLKPEEHRPHSGNEQSEEFVIRLRK